MRSTRGECSGKVRSTPTPYETRRTVKVARAPSPRRRMTTPSKIWTRSFSPSMTFTCTRTVSPGANAVRSRSRLSIPASTTAIASLPIPVSSVPRWRARASRALRCQLLSRQLVQPGPLLAGERHPLEEVGPALERAAERLAAPPAGDPAVVPRQEDLGDRQPPEVGGPGVLGVVEPPGRERLVGRPGRIAEDAGQQADHRVHDDQRGQLAAGQHVVPDRELLVDEVPPHALVHALVVAAQEHEVPLPG